MSARSCRRGSRRRGPSAASADGPPFFNSSASTSPSVRGSTADSWMSRPPFGISPVASVIDDTVCTPGDLARLVDRVAAGSARSRRCSGSRSRRRKFSSIACATELLMPAAKTVTKHDQRQPDHQRRRRDRRAARLAHRVLARQPAGQAAQPLQRPAGDGASGRTSRGLNSDTPNSDQPPRRRRAGPARAAGVLDAAEQADQHHRQADRAEQRSRRRRTTRAAPRRCPAARPRAARPSAARGSRAAPGSARRPA